MATTDEFYQYIKDLCKPIADIKSRKMMGEYVLYYKDKVFGGLYDNRLLIKITSQSKTILSDCNEAIPYPGAKAMIEIAPPENAIVLQNLLDAMYSELSAPKPKKRV